MTYRAPLTFTYVPQMIAPNAYLIREAMLPVRLSIRKNMNDHRTAWERQQQLHTQRQASFSN